MFLLLEVTFSRFRSSSSMRKQLEVAKNFKDDIKNEFSVQSRLEEIENVYIGSLNTT